jgi:hypothetical protein
MPVTSDPQDVLAGDASEGPSYRDRRAGWLLGLWIGGTVGYIVGVWGVPYAEGFWGGVVVCAGLAGWRAIS